jgi:hypothetical protein
MLCVLESNIFSPQLDPVAVMGVTVALRKWLFSRPKSKKKQENVTPLVVEWESRAFRHLGLGKILHSQRILSLFPGEWPEVVLANRLPKPIRVQVFNYPKVSKGPVPAPLPLGEMCPCNSLFAEKFRTLKGCVYTDNLSLIRNPAEVFTQMWHKLSYKS